MLRRWTWACLLLPLLAIVTARGSDEAPFVRVGDVWQFFKAAQEPAGLPGAWTLPGYQAGPDWLTGRSGIGTYVGGRDAENVLLYDRNYNYVAVCFRREFILTEPAAFKWLTLRIDYQEGFVAYLNGTEVLRVGLAGQPGQPVPVNTLSATRVQTRPVEFLLPAGAAALLNPGTNVLAIQMHTDRVGPGFPFSPTTGDLLCTAELLGNFHRGPLVQRASARTVTITWKTPVPASGAVEFGTTPELGKSALASLPGIVQEVPLGGLEPDTLYFYRVRASDGTNEVVSAPASFRTLKESGDITFSVLGDSGSGSDSQYRTAERIRERNPDLVIHAGDIVYSSFDPFRADTRCLSVYGPHMRSTPYFFTVGNHDMLYNLGLSFTDSFCLPTNDVPAEIHQLERTTPEHYYSFDHGGAHFVCLFNPLLNYYDFKPGTAQYAWLERDLAASTKKWKILFQHIPVHTSGPHIYDEYNFNGTNDVEDVRSVLLPLASRYGVNAIFTGHDHFYERFAPDKGVQCIVTGAGGVIPLYPMSKLDPLSARFIPADHHTFVRIRGDSMTVQAIGTNGLTLDEFVVQRAPPPPQAYEADWASIAPVSGGFDDGDGNRVGQKWPFADAPAATIQSSSGTFANLGRLRVSSDTTNLFIGLERVMLPPGADAVLFLEVPGVTGVTNLLGLGNGVLDPDDQGVDGIDFLKNVHFGGFSPAFAIVLGDEFADGTARDFQRGGSIYPGGQGVFRLTPGIDSVTSARVQQFNQSVQTSPMYGEANADYMVISIPCSELGNLAPKESIRIAAIAARPIVDPQVPVREVDTGFIGATMSGSGTNLVVLEGLAVRMPADGDPDRDGLSSVSELLLGTNPGLADSDEDGLDDLWEVVNGLDPIRADGINGAAGDPDGDGLSNLDERRLGTNPRAPGSTVSFRIERMPGDEIRLVWPTLANTICRIEASASLDGPFEELTERPPGPPGISEFRTPVAPGEKFFRVRFTR